MNPEIDLTSFRRGGQIPPGSSSGAMSRPLVAPPRRLLSRYVLPIMLLAAFAAVGAYAVRDSLRPTTAVKVVMPVVTAAGGGGADSSDGTPTPEGPGGEPLFQAPGWIEPYPFQRHLSASVSGVVQRIHVLEGQEVSSGTLVAEMIDEDARNTLLQAEAELNMRRAELQAAERVLNYPLALKEAVRRTQAELLGLEAEKSRMEQGVTIASRESQINRSLAQRGAGGAFSAQKSALEAQAAQLSVAEVEARIKAAEAALETARERLELLIEEKNQVLIAQATVAKAEAAVEDARFRLRQRRIVAETSGTIMNLYVGEGASLSMDMGHGLRIASIYDPAQLQVRADVPMAEVGKLRRDLPVEIKVSALPDHTFHGAISRIVHEADVQKNTLPVKVKILDPDPRLKPEMIVSLQFTTPATTPATPPTEKPGEEPESSESESSEPQIASAGGPTILLIPAGLVPDKADEGKLWVVTADRTAHRKTVKLGSKRGDLRVVLSGIEAPDKIIATNTENLREGSRVRIAATE